MPYYSEYQHHFVFNRQIYYAHAFAEKLNLRPASNLGAQDRFKLEKRYCLAELEDAYRREGHPGIDFTPEQEAIVLLWFKSEYYLSTNLDDFLEDVGGMTHARYMRRV